MIKLFQSPCIHLVKEQILIIRLISYFNDFYKNALLITDY